MNRPGVQQAIELEDTQFASALQWLAGLHACYQGKMPVEYENVDNMDEERKHVWREGTTSLYPNATSELVNLPDNWASFCEAFGWSEWSSLGKRVAVIAPRIAAQLSPLERGG